MAPKKSGNSHKKSAEPSSLFHPGLSSCLPAMFRGASLLKRRPSDTSIQPTESRQPGTGSEQGLKAEASGSAGHCTGPLTAGRTKRAASDVNDANIASAAEEVEDRSLGKRARLHRLRPALQCAGSASSSGSAGHCTGPLTAWRTKRTASDVSDAGPSLGWREADEAEVVFSRQRTRSRLRRLQQALNVAQCGSAGTNAERPQQTPSEDAAPAARSVKINYARKSRGTASYGNYKKHPLPGEFTTVRAAVKTFKTEWIDGERFRTYESKANPFISGAVWVCTKHKQCPYFRRVFSVTDEDTDRKFFQLFESEAQHSAELKEKEDLCKAYQFKKDATGNEAPKNQPTGPAKAKAPAKKVSVKAAPTRGAGDRGTGTAKAKAPEKKVNATSPHMKGGPGRPRKQPQAPLAENCEESASSGGSGQRSQPLEVAAPDTEGTTAEQPEQTPSKDSARDARTGNEDGELPLHEAASKRKRVNEEQDNDPAEVQAARGSADSGSGMLPSHKKESQYHIDPEMAAQIAKFLGNRKFARHLCHVLGWLPDFVASPMEEPAEDADDEAAAKKACPSELTRDLESESAKKTDEVACEAEQGAHAGHLVLEETKEPEEVTDNDEQELEVPQQADRGARNAGIERLEAEPIGRHPAEGRRPVEDLFDEPTVVTLSESRADEHETEGASFSKRLPQPDVLASRSLGGKDEETLGSQDAVAEEESASSDDSDNSSLFSSSASSSSSSGT